MTLSRNAGPPSPGACRTATGNGSPTDQIVGYHLDIMAERWPPDGSNASEEISGPATGKVRPRTMPETYCASQREPRRKGPGSANLLDAMVGRIGHQGDAASVEQLYRGRRRRRKEMVGSLRLVSHENATRVDGVRD